MNERLPYLREKTACLTEKPGVYFMKDKKGSVIYIGKAKNLRNRVSSYFRENANHTPKVAKMVENVEDYDFTVTGSEYEALVLECNMIKLRKPKYNILLRDDKGYSYIKISDERFPRITAEMRNDTAGNFLGPYMSHFTVRQTVDETNAIFGLPTCKKVFPRDFKKSRPCLNYHIGRCMGLCTGQISEEDYRNTVNEAVRHIKTGGKETVKRLEAEMEKASEELNFEYAKVLRDRITAIKKTAEHQKIFADEMKNSDVIGLAVMNEYACVAVIVYRDGRIVDKATYFLGESDTLENMLEDFLMLRYTETNDFPEKIYIESETESREEIEKLISERAGHRVKIVAVTGNRKTGAKLIEMAKQNAMEYISLKYGNSKAMIAVEALGNILGLSEPPRYIEAYDISNLGSTNIVAGMVVFKDGKPLKSNYRRFELKDMIVQNDVESMKQVLERRIKRLDDKKFGEVPDLILLDGGTQQLHAVKQLFDLTGVKIKVFGMVKDSKHRTRAITSDDGEIMLSGEAFRLVTEIQDEVHRFAISYHRKKRTQKMLKG